MELHPITIEDRPWIQDIVLRENSRSADFSFGSMFIWRDLLSQSVGEMGDRLIVRIDAAGGNGSFFACPIGTGNLQPIIAWMDQDCRKRKLPFIMCGVTERYLTLFQEQFPEQFQFRAVPEYYDYIYSASKLATLPGKKLHKKRTHINHFLHAYQWSYHRLTARDFPECNQFFQEWIGRHDVPDQTMLEEYRAFQIALEHYDVLRMDGGVLRVEGKMVAFTIGEQIASDTFLIHFEKGDSRCDGCYPMINRQFSWQIMEHNPEIQWINREDDMGIENLRRSKLSYYPEELVRKYTLTWHLCAQV